MDHSIFENFSQGEINFWISLLFVIAAITDIIDGYIARKYNQVTLLGEVLDPIADKLLILACFMGLMIINRADEWVVFLILAREFIITGIRVVAVGMGMSIAASIYGKMKTLVQIFAIGFLSMEWIGGTVLLYLALFFTIYSGYEYIKDFARQTKGQQI
jgi:CDP-diacylglycerol--glycerol-3-phosphate 3-phosphatidyltransferase